MPRIDHNDPSSWPIGEDHHRAGHNNVIVNREDDESLFTLDNEFVTRTWELLRNFGYISHVNRKYTTSIIITMVNPNAIDMADKDRELLALSASVVAIFDKLDAYDMTTQNIMNAIISDLLSEIEEIRLTAGAMPETNGFPNLSTIEDCQLFLASLK